MTTREAFEAWISQPPYEQSLTRNSEDHTISAWPGQYESYHVQLAWESWLEMSQDRDAWRTMAEQLADCVQNPNKPSVVQARSETKSEKALAAFKALKEKK